MPRRRPVDRSKGPESPNSQRWQTTLTADLDRVAKELKGSMYYDTTSRLATLNARKLANTKTSISFGNEEIVYISDAQANQRLGGEPATPAERAAQTARIKDMKAALTVTNFSLGDEVPVYASVNREAMDLAIKFKGVGRVKMAEDVMNAVKASSLHFGNEPINWESCNMAAFGPKASTNNFQKLKEDTMVLTAALRKHNFSFGEEPIEYISDQTRGYGSVPLGAYRQRIDALPKIKETIQDSRSCHFSLGLDKVRYESIAQEGLRQGYGEGAAADVKAGLERAAKMKADLCRTSIIIGDDAEYM